MSRTVEQIKDKLGIAEVIGTYLKLEKAGQNFRARCPFHQEKTPSFFVSPARGSYHCFGCNRGGDIFSFVEEIEGVDFTGALKILADRAGVEIERAGFERDPEKQSLYEALDLARRYYAEVLKREAPALAYLKERGVKPETIDAFGLGFAPNAWQSLYTALIRRDVKTEILERAGLIAVSQGGTGGRYYDRFRSRIMFPLADASGRTVGFSGRVFGEAAADAKNAKYVNSPETSVYNKGRLLYGYDRAKVEIRRQDVAILVEGQFDLIMSHQAGFTNTVAVSGTALTREHLEHLGRLTRNLVMAFDGDAAGVAASARAIGLALELGLEVKVAELPAGVDPAELILKDEGEWRKRVGEAKHLVDFLLGVTARRASDKRELAHALKREVYPYIAKLRERIDRAHFIAKVADLTGLGESVILADVEEIGRGAPAAKAPPAPDAKPATSRREKIEERLAGLLWWQKRPFPEPLLPRQAELAAREGELSLRAELIYSHLSPPELERELKDLAGNLEIEMMLEERAAVSSRLREAQAGNDEAGERECLKTLQELSRKINDLKNN